ncbi:hypothetical protein MMC11_005242 [Xylographa trunciseda]|nr:hypothetical protein [Xylographa trunciseda]
MQLFKVIWTFFITVADYPARLGSQLSLSFSYDNLPAALKNQHDLHPISNDHDCINSPRRRDCWLSDYNIHTDYEKYVPHTGKTKQYTLVITNAPWSGDGYTEGSMLINGSYPGPVIEANWGDELQITVHNQLTNSNGTSIHWHGIRQLHTNYADGVAGVTQCPIPPNGTMVYNWRARQYGTSWYHSHFSLQYPDGIAGPVVIHGPTSANYDVDLGPLLITDWYHRDAFSLEFEELDGRAVDSPDSKLMNGLYGHFKCLAGDPNCDPQAASSYQVTFVKGKTYKWGVVNTSSGTHYTFWIDGHNFTVVQVDFVPIQPYETNVLNIAIGQRYDIIVDANANTTDHTDFWINMRDCALTSQQDSPYTGIIRYDPTSTADPPLFELDPGSNSCVDEPLESLIPIVPRNPTKVPPFVGGDSFYVSNYNLTRDGQNVFNWELANSSLYINWTTPGLSYAAPSLGAAANQAFPTSYAPIFIDGADDDWVYFVIEGIFPPQDIPHGRSLPVAHPIHLHGHDFVILAQSSTAFNASDYTLITKNPPRRDVAMLPVNGYLIIGFQTDNPGVWLMHCHIAWHASAGLALQFVERAADIDEYIGARVVEDYDERCEAWSKYYDQSQAKQADSGI